MYHFVRLENHIETEIKALNFVNTCKKLGVAVCMTTFSKSKVTHCMNKFVFTVIHFVDKRAIERQFRKLNI